MHFLLFLIYLWVLSIHRRYRYPFRRRIVYWNWVCLDYENLRKWNFVLWFTLIWYFWLTGDRDRFGYRRFIPVKLRSFISLRGRREGYWRNWGCCFLISAIILSSRGQFRIMQLVLMNECRYIEDVTKITWGISCGSYLCRRWERKYAHLWGRFGSIIKSACNRRIGLWVWRIIRL